MDWILRGPQIHNTFSLLGYVEADGYHVNENCNTALEEILKNILAEDKYLRNYRRNIGFGQNIQKDLIPLLIHAEDDKTVDLIIRILVNLTDPVECLLDVEVTSRTDFGRHTIFEINNLLATTKVAFAEQQTSKVVIEFLKKNVDVEPKKKLSEEQLNNVSNCLLLVRNILEIPEHNEIFLSTCNESNHSVQNQIIWNIFSQGIDKLLIKAMTISNSKFYGVTMVQLVALFYKDQHLFTLHKLLTNWHESSLSESSEDNESNTSPTDRGNDDCSTMLMSSDASSNSSDSPDPCLPCSKAGSATSQNIGWDNGPGEDSGAPDDNNQLFQTSDQDIIDDDVYTSSQNNRKNQDNGVCDDKSAEAINEDDITLEMTDLANPNDRVDQNNRKRVISNTSARGYGAQFKNQEFASTSRNDDADLPLKMAKQGPKNKPRPSTTLQERKKRNITKRVEANVINIQGLYHMMPTDDDITKVIQEFAVDFLLKGYNSLVQTLHSEILTKRGVKTDTMHFFWLVTYFMKFAAHIELDLEFINSVLCFEIVSYLVAEAVNLCEQFELAIELGGTDLSLNLRKQHLVVSSIHEFVKAIEVYKKIQLSNEADHEMLQRLQIKMSDAQDLSSLMVLLLRCFNPRYHSMQYLKDLVVTNHILLTFLDDVMQIPEYKCSTKMIDHVLQLSTPAIMAQYGLLLEDFYVNGQLVNDCIFTLMHHVAGDGNRLDTLFQPNIMKTFVSISKSDLEICDDWNDLIKYAIRIYLKKTGVKMCGPPLFLQQNGNDFYLSTESSDSDVESEVTIEEVTKKNNLDTVLQTADNTQQERWTENEVSALSWNYLQCSAKPDVIGAITKQLKEDNIDKSRTSVIRELFRQNLITKDFYESQLKEVSDKNTTTVPLTQKSRDEEIRKACEQLILDGKSYGLEWVQKVLLEICYAKLLQQRKELQSPTPVDLERKFKNFECLRQKLTEISIVSPVIYHSLMMQESVPLVTWNCQQANICKDLKFLQLLHKLGFQMPDDTGRIFIRIPHVWTAEFIYTVAGKIRPIDTSTLKFSVCDLSNSENSNTKESFVESSNKLHQIQKPNFATLVNFTPRPASTFTSANAIEQLNWLQLVKKSKQCKLTLNLKSTTEPITEDIITKSSFRDGGSTSALKSQVTATNTAGLVAPLMLPTTPVLLPTTSVMQPTTTSIMLPSTPVMLPISSFMQPTSSVMLPITSFMQPTSSVMLPITSVMQPTSFVMLPTTSIMMPIKTGMLLTTCVKQPISSVMLPSTSVIEHTTSVTLPSLSKQETAPDDVQRGDCCYSVSGTASIESELTSMDVSDGEENPGVFTSPSIAVAGSSDTTAGEPAARKTKSRKQRKVLIKRIKLTTLPSTVESESSS